MKKILLFCLILLTSVDADLLQQKIENIIDTNNYIKHKNLIDNITKQKDLFYIGDNLRYTKVLDTLNENGLLKLRFNSPKKVTLTFIVNSNPTLAFKILKDTLANLGYSYYFTNSLSYNDKIMRWKIFFKSEYMLDPYIFNKELQRSETVILDINKLSLTSWEYKINVKNTKLSQAIKMEKNEKNKLLKPLKAYLLKVDDAKEIKVISQKLNHWFPSMSFYSKDLTVLGVVKKSRVYKGLKIKLPKDTYYIKIEDRYTLLNIKRGLTIIVK
ncbi:MAG: hypothetical protein KAJ49_04620 [Arcobacteraceae bacterium]|nr:hypothetical protein [Arcobacteraceae bacterium]